MRDRESLTLTLAATLTARAPQLSFILLLISFIPALSTSLPAPLLPSALPLSIWGSRSPRNTFVFIHTRQAAKNNKTSWFSNNKTNKKKTKRKDNQKRIKMQLMNGGMEMEFGNGSGDKSQRRVDLVAAVSLSSTAICCCCGCFLCHWGLMFVSFLFCVCLHCPVAPSPPPLHQCSSSFFLFF